MDHQRPPYSNSARPPPQPSHAYPPPPPSATDQRPPPPYSHHPPPPSDLAQQPQYPYSPAQQQPPPPPHASAPQGPALAPITTYPPQASKAGLPRFQPPHTAPHHSQQQSHEAREAQEYHHNPHNRSGHGTPAGRSFSVDSAHHQRTPTTPAHPNNPPYPPALVQEGAQQQQGQPMDVGQHPHPYGLPNGVHPPHQGPPPPQHDQPYMTPVMDNHNGFAPPQTQTMYPPGANYGPQSNYGLTVQKRKQMRATQACEQCRQRKQKCDEGNPCSFCKESGFTCNYRDTPPAKTDKNMEKLLNYMDENAQAMSRLTSTVESFDSRLRRMEEHRDLQSTSPRITIPEVPDDPAKQIPELDDHRTAPHKLILLWPSVQPLLKEANVDVKDSYVMEAEDRGVLRLWTRGEGIDEYDGTQPGGPASPAPSDDSGEGNTPSPPAGIWGTGFPQTPTSDTSRSSDPYPKSGLKPDGSIDLDMHTINDLYNSYMENMHPMHPFLDEHRLRKLFDSFIKRYSTSPSAIRNMFAVNNMSDGGRPLKRQRSNGPAVPTSYHQEQQQYTLRRDSTERSPGNAIVWLVLALGKVCREKGPLEGPVPDGAAATNAATAHNLTGNSGMTSSSPLSLIKANDMSPKSTPGAQPTPPSMDGHVRLEMHSRRASVDSSSSHRPRNLDRVAGLAYFAKACEIMGDQSDGNDLVHAQMFLLAGLYKGQLARVKESMSYFCQAGRALRMLLDRYKLYAGGYWIAQGDVNKRYENERSRIKDKRHNLIVLASWTCLQLESDILAEMRLPSSGIGTLENMLLYPHKMPENGAETYGGMDIKRDNDAESTDHNTLIFYTAQMFLRKRLNIVHKELYGDVLLHKPLPEVIYTLSEHENTLQEWRETLPPGLLWNDNDTPPEGILEARLRAKYWGARYIINRPFLDFALHIMPHSKDNHRVEDVAKDCNGNPRSKAEIHLFKAIEQMGEEQIWAASKRCIEAAMQSTVAFDSVPDRLIITNIHGTAHAQFGNMLVLSAAFHNSWLKSFVDEPRFRTLITRTIRFLRRLSEISPTCKIDCSILEKINTYMFELTPQEQAVYEGQREPHSVSGSFGGQST